MSPMIPVTKCKSPSQANLSSLILKLLYLISKSTFKAFAAPMHFVPRLDHKPKPPHSLISSGITVPFSTSFPPTASIGLVTNNPLPTFNSASFTMACSGCGGLNMVLELLHNIRKDAVITPCTLTHIFIRKSWGSLQAFQITLECLKHTPGFTDVLSQMHSEVKH